MRIQEVETLVGISKKNIRYYEQEGLVCPGRNRENGYREYTYEDVLLLKKIRLFRRLGVPIEELRRMISGSLTVEDIMKRHAIVLEREKRNLELQKAMCHELALLNTGFSALEPDEFLLKMDMLEEKGVCFVDHRKHDVRKNKMSSLVSAVVMIVIMVFVIGAVIWEYTVEPIPIGMLILIVLFPVAVCIGVVIALRNRIRELNQDEYEEAKKY